MGCSIVEGITGTTIVARRNNSLSTGGRQLVLGFLAVVVLAISSGFAFAGAWLVFPFGGLDMALLYLAFRYVERQAADYECVHVADDKVILERRGHGKLRKQEFNRHWVRAEYSAPRGLQGGRLVLRSHGVEVEFGVHLNEEQRADVARRLKEQLKNR
jgi:uncharacterized membrane protein